MKSENNYPVDERVIQAARMYFFGVRSCAMYGMNSATKMLHLTCIDSSLA